MYSFLMIISSLMVQFVSPLGGIEFLQALSDSDCKVICHICLCKLLKGTLGSELSQSSERMGEVGPHCGSQSPVPLRHKGQRVLPYFSPNFHVHCLGLWADTLKRVRRREQSACLIFLLLYLDCHRTDCAWIPPDPSVNRVQAGALMKPARIYASCILVWRLGTVVSFQTLDCI